MADPVVHITNGLPDSGTGNITTLGQTLVDGANATMGATTDAAVTAGAAGSLSAKLRSISRDIIGGIVLQAGSAIVGKVGIDQTTPGTTDSVTVATAQGAGAAIGTTSGAAVVTDANGTLQQYLRGLVKLFASITFGTYGTAPGAVGALNVNANVTNALSPGRNTPANSAPVVLAKQDYQDLAASTASTAIKGQSGASGAAGDWLDFVLIIPETTAAGTVTLQDGTNTAINIFVTGTLGSLVPFTVPIRANSASGAWNISTGANVHVRAVGNFT